MKKMLALCMLFVLTSCGSVIEDLKSLLPDASVPVGKLAVVAATNWIDPVGSLASIDTSADFLVSEALLTTDGSDVVLRSFFNKIYVINRFGTDTIQVINPANFKNLADYSVGAGSNPQDIWVVSEDKAYVSRLDAQYDKKLTDDVLIINPLTGKKTGSLDFKSYMNDDGDKLSRAGQMVAVDNKLFICLQDLPTSLLDPANASGKVAVVDVDTDEILSVITLKGRNPADITYSSLTKLIYVSNSGVFNNFVTDVTDKFGGIEAIDPETLESKGIVVDDAALGGYTQTLHLTSDTIGYVTVGGTKIAKFNPTTYKVTDKEFYTTTGYYLPDFSVDESGNVYVAETDANDPGVLVLDSHGDVVKGPLAVGAPPTSITFVDVEGENE